MLTELFASAYKTYLKTAGKVTGLGREFSFAVCPDELRPNLQACYRQADTVRTQVLIMNAHQTVELCYLADYFEVQEEFPSFSGLMKFWDGAEHAIPEDDVNRIDFRRTFSIFSAAAKFTRHFEKLPSPARKAVDFGLVLHKSLIIQAIQDGSVDYVRSMER